MNHVRRSLLFSFAERYLTQAVTIATTAVMARLLTPAETGLFMVGYSIILLIEGFRDFGLATYIVQKQELDPGTVRTAFTIMLLLSVGLGGGLLALSGPIADLYAEPELTTLLRIGSIGFFLMPFNMPLFALMRREMAFATIAWINVTAAATNAAVTIVLAAMGFGAASYIWGFVLSNALATGLAFRARSDPGIYRPSLMGWRDVASFGISASLVTLINMTQDMLPRLLLGRFGGMEMVGLFARAVTLCQLPDRLVTGALQPVVLPAMAEAARRGSDLRRAYLAGHRMMSAVQWPVLVVLALLADPAVRLLLGPQWTATVPLVRMIALASMALAPACMTYPLLIATGRYRDTLVQSLVSLPPTALVVAIASYSGPHVLAASIFVVAPLQMGIALWFIRRAIGLTWRDLALASRDSLIITAAAACMPAALVLSVPAGESIDWLRTVLAGVGAGAGWLTTLGAVRHPLHRELTNGWRFVRTRPWFVRRSWQT